ncbi:hypothetical protein [Gellertiella hungarica]|uniref:Uncharacterized protein n=1 Tax=Gellertiella hungarica TaxID=1572859 RepID=A0A7W6J3M3_9HYPH|nr:hypothetical protein [Gellertiella hungarica]MBB4063351.1 hypothetical protein [Gellertiella hungarica]
MISSIDFMEMQIPVERQICGAFGTGGARSSSAPERSRPKSDMHAAYERHPPIRPRTSGSGGGSGVDRMSQLINKVAEPGVDFISDWGSIAPILPFHLFA